MGKIGNVEINGHVLLGPMAGITSLAYREFMKGYGVALSFSEMISDCALVYQNKRTDEYFRTSSSDRPVALQLFGSNPEISAKAVAILEEKAEYDILDLNFGCPVHKVTKTGAGSAFLKDPNRLYQYARAIVAYSHKPVSAKIRLGYDEAHINFREVSSLLVEAGISLITIHSRTTSQLYAGEARHFLLAGLGKELKVPLAISGDIYTPEQAKAAMETTGASYVMVARGGVGNPLLISNIERLLDGKELLPAASLNEQVAFAEDFASRLIAEKGERAAVNELRGILPHFFKGFPGYKKVRNELATEMDSRESMTKILNRVKERGRL